MCGEKLPLSRGFAMIAGSPPRVRGKVHGSHGRELRPGITPACAGKRSCSPTRGRLHRDHPRVCGEKVFGIPISVSNMGSPPRVRGKVVRPLWKKCSMRITPACAGKRLKKSKKINNPSPLAHRISFSFSYTANVRRQSVSARCAPETSRPKYVASVVSL